MKNNDKKYYIGKSDIHGSGVIANCKIKKGEEIEIGINFLMTLIPVVTHYFGDWINHSWTPNSKLDFRKGKYYSIAIKNINKNEEITMNYHESPWYILPPSSKWD